MSLATPKRRVPEDATLNLSELLLRLLVVSVCLCFPTAETNRISHAAFKRPLSTSQLSRLK